MAQQPAEPCRPFQPAHLGRMSQREADAWLVVQNNVICTGTVPRSTGSSGDPAQALAASGRLRRTVALPKFE
jgi:hypothetical protein